MKTAILAIIMSTLFVLLVFFWLGVGSGLIDPHRLFFGERSIHTLFQRD